jgi:hypothetical protein
MAELEDATKQKLRFITRTSLITLSPGPYLGSMTAKVTRRVAEEMGSMAAQAPKTQASPEGLKAAMRLNKAVLFLHNMMLQSFTALKQFRNTLPDDLNQHPAGEPLLNILTDIRRLQKPLTELHQRTQQLVGALNGQKTAARKLGSVDAPNEAMEFAARVRKIAQLADAADAAILAGNKERADKLMQLATVTLKEAADFGAAPAADGGDKQAVAAEIRKLRGDYVHGLIRLLKKSNLTPDSMSKIIEHEIEQIRRNLLP